MDVPWNEFEPLIPLTISAALSAVIGWEREAANRPAGLRTHMLVAMTSTLLTVLGFVILERVGDHAAARVDPIRVTQSIIAGVAFIGAGTIFVGGKNNRVTGLTTAASLLAVAGVGIACGLELYLLAAATCALVFVVLYLLRVLERRAKGSSRGDAD